MTPKSRSELAYLYGYNCTRTFTRHLKTIGIKLRAYKAIYLDSQLKIYAEMGIPPLLNQEERKKIAPLLHDYIQHK